MKLIPMIAVADFEWNGVERTNGERFEVIPIEAAVLLRARRARFITGDDPGDPNYGPDVLVDLSPPLIIPAQQESKEIDTRPRRKPRKRRKDIAKSPYTKVLH